MRTKRGLAWLGVGAATLFLGGVASADIQTFYKTTVCPNFGGLKPPIASELGEMEAAQDNAVFAGGLGSGGVGGIFCNLDSLPKMAFGMNFKQYAVGNASVVMNPGDYADGGFPGGAWSCVVCQYEDKVAAHPALSMWGTIALMGGVVTAMIFELRRRQAGGSA